MEKESLNDQSNHRVNAETIRSLFNDDGKMLDTSLLRKCLFKFAYHCHSASTLIKLEPLFKKNCGCKIISHGLPEKQLHVIPNYDLNKDALELYVSQKDDNVKDQIFLAMKRLGKMDYYIFLWRIEEIELKKIKKFVELEGIVAPSSNLTDEEDNTISLLYAAKLRLETALSVEERLGKDFKEKKSDNSKKEKVESILQQIEKYLK